VIDQPLTSAAHPTAVIGAGVMGRGIAQVAALAGHDTRLVDISADQLEDAMRAIGADLDGGVARGKLDPAVAAAALARITTTTDLSTGCDGAELVIEAVVERMDVKHTVLVAAEQAAATDAVLATNTSAMSVTEIVGCLEDPSRGVGMHFFNPVPRMRLCELIRGRATATETLDRAAAAAHGMGKETVRVEDVAGFATSRINALIGAEAMRMLEDRVASAEDIDAAVKLGLNHPMGPLEMGDLVGWDTRLDILEYLAGELGDRFAPTELHRRLVAEGRLGRKSGRGVHRYDADGRRISDDTV
jgi:3-hydroxybutyryl-CoA dehydrogenase